MTFSFHKCINSWYPVKCKDSQSTCRLMQTNQVIYASVCPPPDQKQPVQAYLHWWFFGFIFFSKMHCYKCKFNNTFLILKICHIGYRNLVRHAWFNDIFWSFWLFENSYFCQLYLCGPQMNKTCISSYMQSKFIKKQKVDYVHRSFM